MIKHWAPESQCHNMYPSTIVINAIHKNWIDKLHTSSWYYICSESFWQRTEILRGQTTLWAKQLHPRDSINKILLVMVASNLGFWISGVISQFDWALVKTWLTSSHLNVQVLSKQKSKIIYSSGFPAILNSLQNIPKSNMVNERKDW